MKNESNTKNSIVVITKSLLAVLLMLILASCEGDVTPVAYQDKESGATPVINTVDPPDKAT